MEYRKWSTFNTDWSQNIKSTLLFYEVTILMSIENGVLLRSAMKVMSEFIIYQKNGPTFYNSFKEEEQQNPNIY